jgi:hypothetical protein
MKIKKDAIDSTEGEAPRCEQSYRFQQFSFLFFVLSASSAPSVAIAFFVFFLLAIARQ